MADDMTDGLLDGIGGAAAHKRIAAVSTLVSAKVLIEAGKVRINKEQLKQTKTSINASIILLPSTELSAIADILKTLEENSLPADIKAVLPASAGGDIDDAIVVVSIATETEIDQFNRRILAELQNNIVIVNFNRPPPLLITGVPASAVYENTRYTFTPAINEQNADLFTYSISNKPSWANFNDVTGVLTGVPGNSDVGTTGNINISVSDGFSSAVSLPTFSITVESTTAILSWVAPTTSADSSPLPLSDIKGYKIYTGTNTNNLTLLFDINDSSVDEHTIRNLTAAKHYYAIKTYNQSGMESVFSDIVSKTINSL